LPYRFVSVVLVTGVVVALPGAFRREEARPLAAVAAPQRLAAARLRLTLFARVPRPTAMAVRYGDDAIYVASKKGRVWALRGGRREVVLDIANEISSAFEQGLLGIAFTPDGKLLVVNFTDRDNSSVTRVYDFDDERADPFTWKNLFVVKKPAREHNGGNLVFGPDGYLYVTIGDGGISGDPKNNAQSLRTMLGKVLRVEVLPNGSYAIPQDNPFAGRRGMRGEIWDYGLRNPWRLSFDRSTGDLWIADVGRDRREEIDFEEAGSEGGRNYGWNRMEGSVRFGDHHKPKKAVRPVYDYAHDGAVCAVTGGYVYRGSRIPGLAGAYLFSDFCKGGIEALRLRDGKVVEHRVFPLPVAQISSFGQDAEGELYVLVLEEGAIYRVDPA
jgi:glucose/arabinose dehydrogenase